MAGDDKPTEIGADVSKPEPGSSDGGGRNRSCRGRRGANGFKLNALQPPKVKFDGSCEGLKGHVYDMLDYKQADAFTKTTKELAGYVGRTMKEGDDVRLAVQNLKLPTFNKPKQPVGEVDEYSKLEYGTEVKLHLGRVAQLASNMRTLYNIVIGQCSESMVNKLESTDGFDTISSTSDSIGLLVAIKKISYNHETQKFSVHGMHEAMTMFTCVANVNGLLLLSRISNHLTIMRQLLPTAEEH
jgi:hypothetical protein